jgi:DNA polymerase-3 subunit gamma/tau
MTYLALARKWRPRTFSQMVGQEPIIKALTNSLNQQRLHHAYLFSGTRGVGKTSVARLFAKALNCEQALSAEPCLQCEACIAIEQGRFIDLLEIDGASRTRVEDTRELLDNIQYAPTNARFKIYLIDEVHMLSQHSFNALLKTLEEPPSHVKFLLATTDPQKLPMTVLSRCLQFNLKHLPAEIICKHLQYILDEEQCTYELPALEILAHAARGSMRDALSLLDQVLASTNNGIQTQDVKSILGYTQQDYAIQLLQALSQKNIMLIHQLIQQIAAEGGHFTYVLEEIMNYLHQIAVHQSLGKQQNHSTINTIQNLADIFIPEDCQLFYQIAIKGSEEMHLAPTLAIGFTMILLRMFTFQPVSAPKAITGIDKSFVAIQEPINERQSQTEISKEPLTSITNIEIKNTDTDWTSIIPKLNLNGLALNAAKNAEFISKDGMEYFLRVAPGHSSLFSPSIHARIEAALTAYYQAKIKLIIRNEELIQASPAQQHQQELVQNAQEAEIHLQNDPIIQQLQQDFSAELLKNSIISLKNDI